MVPERRQQLVQYAKAHEMKVISDDVYQLLSFPGHRPPPPLRTFDEEGDTVVSISSFSKIMAPGLRCGQAPLETYHAQLRRFVELTDGMLLHTSQVGRGQQTTVRPDTVKWGYH
eukprot:scaffold3428_cov379-Prasinococcus_capsulatus_cf.AAC.17